MKVVLDSNVIISATLIRGGKENRVLRAWQRGALDLVPSTVLKPPVVVATIKAPSAFIVGLSLPGNCRRTGAGTVL